MSETLGAKMWFRRNQFATVSSSGSQAGSVLMAKLGDKGPDEGWITGKMMMNESERRFVSLRFTLRFRERLDSL
jgi:hypothetical protein